MSEPKFKDPRPHRTRQPRNNSAYALEAWFYADERGIDVVVRPRPGGGTIARLSWSQIEAAARREGRTLRRQPHPSEGSPR